MKKRQKKGRKKGTKKTVYFWTDREYKIFSLSIKKIIDNPTKYNIFNHKHGWNAQHNNALCNLMINDREADEEKGYIFYPKGMVYRDQLSIKRKIEHLMNNTSKNSKLNNNARIGISQIMSFNAEHTEYGPSSSIAALSGYTNDCLENDVRNIKRHLAKKSKSSASEILDPLMNLVTVLTASVGSNLTSESGASKTECKENIVQSKNEKMNVNLHQYSRNDVLEVAFQYELISEHDEKVYYGLLAINDLTSVE